VALSDEEKEAIAHHPEKGKNFVWPPSHYHEFVDDAVEVTS